MVAPNYVQKPKTLEEAKFDETASHVLLLVAVVGSEDGVERRFALQIVASGSPETVVAATQRLQLSELKQQLAQQTGTHVLVNPHGIIVNISVPTETLATHVANAMRAIDPTVTDAALSASIDGFFVALGKHGDELEAKMMESENYLASLVTEANAMGRTFGVLLYAYRTPEGQISQFIRGCGELSELEKVNAQPIVDVFANIMGKEYANEHQHHLPPIKSVVINMLQTTEQTAADVAAFHLSVAPDLTERNAHLAADGFYKQIGRIMLDLQEERLKRESEMS